MNPLIPQGAPPQMAPQQQASAEDIAKGHEMTGHFLSGLTTLASKPYGQLTKQDVFKGAADMMAKGLFSDPQSRMGMIQQLTQLPDDESALRQWLGKEIMQVMSAKDRLDAMGGGNAD